MVSQFKWGKSKPMDLPFYFSQVRSHRFHLKNRAWQGPDGTGWLSFICFDMIDKFIIPFRVLLALRGWKSLTWVFCITVMILLGCASGIQQMYSTKFICTVLIAIFCMAQIASAEEHHVRKGFWGGIDAGAGYLKQSFNNRNEDDVYRCFSCSKNAGR